MKNVLDNIISAVRSVGIGCEREYCRIRGYSKGLAAYAGIEKLRFERLRDGVSDISVRVRVTVQSIGGDGTEVMQAAEEKVVPAVVNCGEDIFGAEISEVKYEPSSDRVYCEIFFDVRRGGYGICK